MAISRSQASSQMRGSKTKRLTSEEKYRQLKAQTEAAGMKVEEKNGKIVVSRRKKS